MIKGNRIQGTNTTYVGSHTIITSMLNVPAGKTFVLTDLIVSGTHSVGDQITEASNLALKLYDVSGESGTAASGTNTPRLSINLPLNMNGSADSAAAFKKGSVVLHFTNGPEFSNGVTPATTNGGTTGTGCVWVAGYLK